MDISKNVESVVLHGYNQSVTPDAANGAVLTATFGKGVVAITLISPSATGPILSSPVASDSMDFVGNALTVLVVLVVLKQKIRIVQYKYSLCGITDMAEDFK